jgi:hypothetical protein
VTLANVKIYSGKKMILDVYSDELAIKFRYKKPDGDKTARHFQVWK